MTKKTKAEKYKIGFIISAIITLCYILITIIPKYVSANHLHTFSSVYQVKQYLNMSETQLSKIILPDTGCFILAMTTSIFLIAYSIYQLNKEKNKQNKTKWSYNLIWGILLLINNFFFFTTESPIWNIIFNSNTKIPIFINIFIYIFIMAMFMSLPCLVIIHGIFLLFTKTNKHYHTILLICAIILTITTFKDSAISNMAFMMQETSDCTLDELAHGAPENDAQSNTIKYESSSSDTNNETTSEPQHSTTYTQIKEIDEADIVKTDGKYIYFVNKTTHDIIIDKVEGGKISKASVIKWNNFNATPETMFLDKNKLIIIGTSDTIPYQDKENNIQEISQTITVINIFDISNRNNPKSVYTFAQLGGYQTSRYYNHQCYLVSNGSIENSLDIEDYFYTNNEDTDYIYPVYGENGNTKRIKPFDISYLTNSKTKNHSTVSIINTNKLKMKSIKVIFGDIQDIYMNQKNLYLAMVNQETEDKSDIVKIALNDGNLETKTSVSIPGIVLNQYSMDEYNGYFRVATTTTSEDWIKDNYIFIMNENLKTKGYINKLCYNEDIKAVRYQGDVAYVVTFRNTDPLFVVDFKNPTKPVLKGELEITGFSTLLEPLDNNRLLGIGYADEESAGGGLKLSLFDVSDPYEPKLIDAMEQTETTSELQENPHALLKNEQEQYYGFAYQSDNEQIIAEENQPIKDDQINDQTTNANDWQTSQEVHQNQENQPVQSRSYACLFNLKNNKINIFKNIKLNYDANRLLWIDDWIYAIGNEDTVEPIYLNMIGGELHE